jgi:hypothetical protein
VFNYILNILNVQRDFSKISSLEDMQKKLLSGATFSHITSIDHDGTVDLYDVLAKGNVKGEVFGKGTKIKPNKDKGFEISSLRNEKQKIERALDRLRNLYLYSEGEMSEKEYFVERNKLTSRLDELNDEIGIVQSDEWQQSVSDEMLITRASEFIITQKLTDRSYVCYKRLARSVDASVIRSFVTSIIDSIIITDGMVRRITFKNGLSHIFTYNH